MLAELGGRLFREAFAADNTPEDMRAYLAEHFTEDALRRLLDDPDVSLLVLEDGGTPVGWAHLVAGRQAPGAPAPAPGGEVEIRRFYLDPRLHGGDAGPTLLASALRRVRELGAGAVWLAVWERNGRALGFYRKHGFRRVGTQGFRLGADTQTDDVLHRPLSFGVSVAIVAGGGATRLGGVCKPLLRVRGRPVLERLLALRTLADEVLLVSADPRLPDVDAVAYTVAGRLEPLAALYRSALAPRFAEALSRQGESFRTLWGRLRGRTLPESALREATGDVRAVLSLNLPSDVATWVDTPPDPRS